LSSDDGASGTTMGLQTKEKTKQESVWKIEATSAEGCTFICPQLQSFDTSLPHLQQGTSADQATSVVDHRVTIAGAELRAKVTLNKNEAVGRNSCPEFEKTKQVGPMLDFVASLRYCVGYADRNLLDSTRYLLSKTALLPPQIKKVLGMVAVDEHFRYRRQNGTKGKGTLRASTCHFVADDSAHRTSNVCSQCKLLQEPLEFLGLWL